MKPTIGRIVHYRAGYYVAQQPIAALVTAVIDDETVSLVAFPPDQAAYPVLAAQWCDVPIPGTWDWPPRD